MKKTFIIVFGCVFISVAFAGKIDLKDAPALKAKAAIAKDADASVTWAGIKADTEAVGAALDAINLGSITNTVFTGTQRTAITNIKDTLQALKVANKNQMQAMNKLVKKLKETERIEKEAHR